MSKKKTNKKGENKMNENIEEIVNTIEPVIEEPVIEEPVIEPEVEPELPEVEPELPEVEPELPEVDPELPEVEPELPEVVRAVVVGCDRLNIRENPSKDAKIVCVIDKGTEVQINLDDSTEDFYGVYTSDKDGYCMKQFINIK